MSIKREEGSTLVAVVLVTMVLLIIGGTVLQMSDHTTQSTTVDRLRVQAVQAAEAGVNTAIKRLELNGACDSAVSAPVTLTDGSRTLASYRTRVDEEPGTACSSENRVIRSWGTAPTESERSLRQLEVTVQMIPNKGFRFTLFASGSEGIVTANNTPTVDGDIYAEYLDQTNNNIIADHIVTPGSIDTKNGAIYTGTLWAGGNVTLRQNGQVGGSIIAAGSSAPGDVVLENGVNIGKDVKARGSIALPTSYTVGGVISPDNPWLSPPPNLEKPVFTWNPANYAPLPETFTSSTAAADRMWALRSNLQGTFYVDDPAGTLNMAISNGNYNVTGPLTIVSNGKINLGKNYANTGGPWPVIIVSTKAASDAIEIKTPTTFSPSLHVLLFAANGGVRIGSNTSMTGSIYADRIDINNKLLITRSPLLAQNPVPGFDWNLAAASRFTVVPLSWREVAPQAP